MARTESLRAQRTRARIAQVAARLIAEHGLTDWNNAKRKACRELGLPQDESLPPNEEIEQALHEYNTLFGGRAQPAALAAKRAEALRWMDRFAEWRPVLVGGVAAGWANEHSDIVIELEADESKVVELALVNGAVSYVAIPPGGVGQPAQLRIEGEEAAIRLVIVTSSQRRHRNRRDEAARLSRDELVAAMSRV